MTNIKLSSLENTKGHLCCLSSPMPVLFVNEMYSGLNLARFLNEQKLTVKKVLLFVTTYYC